MLETDSSGFFYSVYVHDYRIADTACVAVGRINAELLKRGRRGLSNREVSVAFLSAANDLFPDLQFGEVIAIAQYAQAEFFEIADIEPDGEA